MVIDVENADIMATLLRLKAETETKNGKGKGVKMTFVGATESHILAKELAAADVGVIITPPRSFPYDWERKRMYDSSCLPRSSLI